VGVTKGVADLTGLLQAWSRGDAEALEQLAPLVSLELRGVARRMLSRERQADGWQPTDLVQESYVRLLDWRVVRWQNRAHFFATTAKMMRRVLVDVRVRDAPANVAAAWTPRRSRAWTSRRQNDSWTSSRSKMR
jgi:DNA-directed RNA polymerase specialized sigma24 family protein